MLLGSLVMTMTPSDSPARLLLTSRFKGDDRINLAISSTEHFSFCSVIMTYDDALEVVGDVADKQENTSLY